MRSFLEEVIGKDFSEATINDLSPTDLLAVAGKKIERVFDQMVDFLRSPEKVQNKSVNELVALLWRLVGNKIVPAAVGNLTVKDSMSFWCEGKNDRTIATIIVPTTWIDKIKSDSHMQMGAMVYNASKAKDYWNLKLYRNQAEAQEGHKRAMAYESELLNFFKKDPFWLPNEYQKQVLEFFPSGISSPAAAGLIYPGRPFSFDFPPFPVL